MDVNADGRDEVIMNLREANTWSTARLITLDECQVAEVQFLDGDVLGYNIHSMCCPGGSESLQCEDLDGDGRVEPIRASEAVSAPDLNGDDREDGEDIHLADESQLRRNWHVSAYELRGRVLSIKQTLSGSWKPPDRPNAPFDITNGLECGPVTD